MDHRILDTFVLGFVVSTLGYLATQILVGHLIGLAVVTLVLRLAAVRRLPGLAGVEREAPRTATILQLTRPDTRVVLLPTGVFYLFCSSASTVVGTYGTYYLITVTGLSQTQATGLVLFTFPTALIMSLVFVRRADTVWRDRPFAAAMPVQVAAFAVGGLTGGETLRGMATLMVLLYSLSNVFAGEAAYKVWSQLLLAAELRSTAMGMT